MSKVTYERERLFEVVVDHVHAAFFIVALPILLGLLVAGVLGWWAGSAVVLVAGLNGARGVRRRGTNG